MDRKLEIKFQPLFLSGFLLLFSLKVFSQNVQFWYGKEQHFGYPGNTQECVNILGTISSSTEVDVSYQINSGEHIAVTLGSDLHRLAGNGDFNIDIERSKLREGKNLLELNLFKKSTKTFLKKDSVWIHYSNQNIWPLPYAVKWDTVTNIQKVTQVIDGHWEIGTEGIQNKDVYYDRTLGFGDSTWRNYEVEAEIKIAGMNLPEKGPPTYDVIHAALAVYWPGHDKDSLQPHRKWFPLGATAEYRIRENASNASWRIFDGKNFYVEEPEKKQRSFHTWYRFKHRVENVESNTVIYKVKFWQADTTEPEEWDLIGKEQNADYLSGSALLLAHHTQLVCKWIQIRPL